MIRTKPRSQSATAYIQDRREAEQRRVLSPLNSMGDRAFSMHGCADYCLLQMGYQPLIVTRHFGVMTLTPEQHAQIAAVYDKCAADHMVPPQHRAAFARKAEMFRMLARLGAKPKSTPRPARPKKLPSLPMSRHTKQSRNAISGAAPICVAATSVAWRYCLPRAAPHPVSTFAVRHQPAL